LPATEQPEPNRRWKWIADQLCDDETPEGIALTPIVLVPLVISAVCGWMFLTVGTWAAVSSGLLLIALVLAVLKTVGWRMGPRSAQLYLYRARGWRRLWHLRFRKVLDMRGTNTTDADLRSLQSEWKIEVLDLENSRITDDGIHELMRLETLRYLVLRGTAVSQEGLAELKQRLPKTRMWS
jgi:hypothetical protein